MTPHRDTIRKQLGITTPSYRDMMRVELRGQFAAARNIARMTESPATRAKAVNWMAHYRHQLAHLDTWSRDYV